MMKHFRARLPFSLLLCGALGIAAIGSAADDKKSEKTDAGPAPSAEETKAYEILAAKGVLVQPIAANLNWRYVNFRGVEKPDPEVFAALKPCLLVQELDLSGVKFTDADLANIAGMKNLLKLNLARSAANDAALAHLKGLEKLEVLNLFHTEVTDAGLAHLHPVKNLKRIYVFETKVTDAGANALQQALPNVKIERGWQVTAAKPAEAEKNEAPKPAEPKPAEKKEPPKPEPPKPEAKKEPAKPEPPKPDAPKPDAPKPDAPKPEEKKDAPKPPEPKPKDA